MGKNRIVVATMTWARDEQEENLLREALAVLARENITTFVADRGSPGEFIKFLEALPEFHVLSAAGAAGVFPQVKHSLHAAADSGADFILYTEPDKKYFFENKLRRFLSSCPLEENVGAVLASRTAESFATFPEFQQYTETVINKLCEEMVDEQGDYTYGPFLFNRNLTACLDLAGDEVGWGWRPFLFALAKSKGYKIVLRQDEYPCPETQREDNPRERIYRMKQLSQNIDGLVLSTKISLDG